MKKKNLIIICIDGCRLDRVLKSKVFKHLATKGIFFPQTITYAPYTNSAIHALISGSYGNRNVSRAISETRLWFNPDRK